MKGKRAETGNVANRGFGYRVVLILLCLFLIGSFSLFATELSPDQMLLVESLSFANRQELLVIGERLGMSFPSEMQEDAIRAQILSNYNIAVTELVLTSAEEADSQSYTLQILHADSMTSVSDAQSLIVLQGNVEISFQTEGNETPKLLKAQRIIIDLDNTRLTAMGGVIYSDPTEQATVQEMAGEVISLNWELESLSVSGGTTTSSRSNVDDEEVSFSIGGSLIRYEGEGAGIHLDDGLITTNPEHAYSSIHASQMSLMPNGDMFISNAHISIGRVPVFWLPFLFYPGSTLVFNPAFGLESSRGMFLNTTTEIYGTYPGISDTKAQSSFTSFLVSDSEAQEKDREGMIYVEQSNQELSALESWARSSGSYLAVLADVYQYDGIFAGIETGNYFLNKTISLEYFGGVALYPAISRPAIIAPLFRYVNQLTVKANTKNITLSLALPFYSDPRALGTYANRLTTFSLDALFGIQQTFPTVKAATVNTFSWALTSAITIPTSAVTPYIEKFQITKLDASVGWQWIAAKQAYEITSATLPALNAKISGKLFSLEVPYEVEEEKEKTYQGNLTNEFRDRISDFESQEATPESDNNEIEEDTETSEDIGPQVKETEVNIPELLKQAGISDAYGVIGTSTQRATVPITAHKLSLAYSIDQQFTNSWNAVSGGSLSTSPRTLYSRTKGEVVFSGAVAPSWLTFTQNISPQFTFSEEDEKDYQSSQLQIQTSTAVAIPLVGLSYSLAGRLYTLRHIKSAGLPIDYYEQWMKWDKASITTHSVTLSRNFVTETAGTFTVSLTGVLPPLRISLLPALKWSTEQWNAGVSWRFAEDGSGALQSDLISGDLGWKNAWITTSLSIGYRSQLLNGVTIKWWEPLTVKASASFSFFEEKLKVGQSVEYLATSGSDTHMFKNIQTKIESPWASLSLDFGGTFDAIKLKTMNVDAKTEDVTFLFWKNRIKLTLGANAALQYNFLDPFASQFTITGKIGFSIAEFLDFTFSVSSQNNSFFKYYDDQNAFNFGEMFKDLLRSFDFFGDGRRNTGFNLQSMSLELVHYMEDWDLHCKYTGSIVLSANQYSWVPKVTVYLQWKTIPELKVDEQWTQRNGTWSQTN